MDEAAHDLWGKRRGQPVWKLWGLDCKAGPPTDYTIGIDTIEVMVAKLVKCGGLTPARRMIARARQLGLKVMIGCMTESTMGISAIAQLRPMLDYVDMDGALLLAIDVATGVTIKKGRVKYLKANGCGVRLLA